MGSSEDLVGGQSSLGKWLAVALIVIGIPAFLLTDFALEKAQKIVIDNEKKSWAGTLQHAIAVGYSTKFDHRKAAERYEWAARYAFFAGEQEEGAWLLFNQAVEVEAADSNGKWAALPMYEKLASDYADKPVGARAAGNVTRIKTMARP